ncbi:16S rRNA (guanine(527)-N(7))-methyltransferase RsmG [Pseudotabrizicola formosa]|uniref:16S rRNA (guanine(527)-N(7))-methyltransferase RsmG n=1 Tax=Pseudotabrizicola formosa TaxID=2030009 RepID=UPI000CD2FD66|nr:16S rRNA (guanine(527)-N(7))-methyltransferase RsmG [Pseudotabrizicola formosa]
MAGTTAIEPLGIVSRETVERLEMFASLVRKWNPTINLVSKGSIAQLYDRHILDSLQLFDLTDLQEGVWGDLGSGGGFPALVVACVAAGSGRNFTIRMVEADSRKAAFLREAARQLDVNAVVINARIEEAAPLAANVLSARALGPLPKLCGFAARHLGKGGVALFPKGLNHDSEVAAARADWTFDLKLHPSKTEPAAAILELRNIQHV